MFLLLILALLFLGLHGEGLVGEPYHCLNEGELMHVASTFPGTDSCLSCFCQNHIVQCKTPKCALTDGCYRLRKRRRPECCQICMGCLHEGREVPHGHSWKEGCRLFQCQAGVLTSSNVQCHVPCAKPTPPAPGECCPLCDECWLEGQKVPEGSIVSPRLDPCVKCSCTGGELSCVKKPCPVLSCPAHRAILGPDDCCPECNGSREVFVPPGGRCFLEQFFQSGENRTFDPCTTCSCKTGFLQCERYTCPPLECPKMYSQDSGGCCPKCVYPTHSKACLINGVVRENGDTWKHDRCSTCSCTHGQVRCEVDPCEYVNKECPVGFKKVKSEEDCCPWCQEEPGVCVIYGDSHYKTFDKYQFNFQGECRYELTKDCEGGNFAIRVNNDARSSSYFSWKRSLSIKIQANGHKYKVCLGQRLRTKVNRARVKLPHIRPGLNITRKGFLITVTSSTGVNVSWDGASYVEVSVSADWRNRTCGLCGNFNLYPWDDSNTRKGIPTSSDVDVGNSWQSGKSKSCSRRLKRLRLKDNSDTQIRTQRLTCLNSRLEARKRCEGFNASLFHACREKVDVESYYSACLLDMCECSSSRLCECDTIIAYVRECERAMVNVSGWQTITECGGFSCPYGSIFKKCAPACRSTCKNPTPNPDCHMRRCRPEECYCPTPTVLHRGSCIAPEMCPRKRRYGRSADDVAGPRA